MRDTPEKFDLAVLLTRITFPYLLCMSLVALLSGVLNSLGKFVESSAVSIVLNLTLMAAMLLSLALGFGNERTAGVIQAWGVFAAGILQLRAADRRRAPQRHAAAAAPAAHDARACAASSRSAFRA